MLINPFVKELLVPPEVQSKKDRIKVLNFFQSLTDENKKDPQPMIPDGIRYEWAFAPKNQELVIVELSADKWIIVRNKKIIAKGILNSVLSYFT